MAKLIYPLNNADFLVWLINFINIATGNKAALGLSDAELLDLTNMQAALETLVNENQAKHEAAQAATVALKGKRLEVNQLVGYYNKIFKANPAIAASLVESLGLNANDGSLTSTVPVEPTDLVVEGRSNGINYLKFNRNGNKSTVNFIVEAKVGDAAAYSFVTVTRKQRLEHKNQTPGVRVFYRVKAVHGDLESAYSNEAVIYN
jgi:hypothetical protein